MPVTVWTDKLREMLGSATRFGDPISSAQKLLSANDQPAFESLIEAINSIVAHELWRQGTSENGEPFADFASFATARIPLGLGIKTQRAADLLCEALEANNHVDEWVSVLERIVRKPGRPGNNANSSDSRFYKLPDSATSRNRLLLKLKHSGTDEYNNVCAGHLSAYKAAVHAGLVGARAPEFRFGAFNTERAKGLTPKRKARLLQHVFDELGPDAQCALIASRLDGVL